MSMLKSLWCEWHQSSRQDQGLLLLAVLLGLALPISTALTNILVPILALLGLWLGRASLPVVLRQPVSWLALLLFVALLVGMTYTRAPDAMDFLLKYRKVLFLPFLAAFFLLDRRLLTWVLGGFLTGNVLILLASTVLWVLVDLAWFGPLGISHRCFPGLAASCVIKNGIAQSLLLALAAGLTVILAMQSSRYRSALLALLAWLVLGDLVLSHQRIGFLAILILAIWFFFVLFQNRIKWLCLAIGLPLLLAVALTPNPISERVVLGFTEIGQCIDVVNVPGARDTACHSSMGLRTYFYTQSLTRIQASPWIGHGTGNLGIPDLAEFDVKNTHNEYFMQGVQVGMIGILLFLGLLVSGFVLATRLPKPWFALGTGVVLVYAAGSLLNSFLLDVTEGNTLVVLLAMILAASKYFSETARGD